VSSKTVTATASKKDKLDWLLSIPNGATHVANYKTQDFATEVKNATNGKGVDIVIDFVGPSHFTSNLNSLAMDGTMIILGLLSGECLLLLHTVQNKLLFDFAGFNLKELNMGPILYKRLRIQGSTLRSRPLDFQIDLVSRRVSLLAVNNMI
jgi:NADPH:quinone reductase-like Zn-dependent oxidoreductase